jgi:coenzyme Q-binding protein COQ10
MPQYASERRVPYAAGTMFDLVADCEAYPEFVPLCDSLVITGRGEEDGKEIIIAEMTVAYGPMRETFTTRDVLDRDALVIDVAYLDGPFRRFNSQWRFEPGGDDQSIVHFTVDYELRSRVMAAVAGPVIERSFHDFIEAFEARADKVHGRKASA